jgi:hypothetical protein
LEKKLSSRPQAIGSLEKETLVPPAGDRLLVEGAVGEAD